MRKHQQLFHCMALMIPRKMTDLISMKYLQAEVTLKQLENLSPPIMKQLPPLYMDLVKGREDFTPKPEETRRLVCETINQ